ncbi:MAG TPA: beta-L-arabinofuranosidase domain-containing protein [Ktedonobacteraceae bacterium]|nr:beta-L-arabinofuranosidase domain-containing protein [Ktedonobacteraceae bacterium]
MYTAPEERPSVSSSATEPLTPVSWKNVSIDDAFWSPRLRANREHTLPHIYRMSQETGRIDALRLNWKPGEVPVPHVFWDSDIAKWLEAASYSLGTHPDPILEEQVDEVVGLLAAAQQPDGYLNSHFIAVEPAKRWTNLRDLHELYCAGHLIEAAVAHFQATGKRNLLDILIRYADHIDSVFGPEPGKKCGYPGHEEIELALVKLYRVTGEQRYLRLSQYFVEERGREPHYYDEEARLRGEDPATYWAGTYEYNQSHLPVREQREVTGHAVRAMYLYSAMTDLARELGDDSLLAACERLWQHLCTRRTYITGGIGSSPYNEGFSADYDLPNETAYAETCAAIGLVFWNHRLLQLECDGRYADMLEAALYNSVLSGVSLDGETFFYDNPLASRGAHHRQGWFECACCPPNIARLLASLGLYIYAANERDLAVHLYIRSAARVRVGGQVFTLRQETDYPWNGTITFRFAMDEPAAFGLKLRIPGWCHEAHLSVNGEAIDIAANVQQGYVRVERLWQQGDCVELVLAMPVARMHAHPDVLQDVGRVALKRGPLVYCLEGVDQADRRVPLQRILLPQDAELSARFQPELLGGVEVIHGPALVEDDSDWGVALYRSQPPTQHPTPITAIPYYAWDNRQSGEMLVWLRER